ncbi:uncharacterized protein ColSpa_05402 [Colletotrichum spaethianum]|uniref:Uncharacterized protein n=1 Tax=Colletotrichum spaethianum TaxID=700344 RepID=A0AA37LAS6_9PEZI|nr:uncharacterized protein ColSpa_05402 [Colletotrichum spaethianum]GKT45221.1 hypothetical protein ColSpa_05402 [Colletotrichum spaethianum]
MVIHNGTPAILSYLLDVFVRPLEGLFYHADLCAAYHIFGAAFIYLTTWLKAVVKTTRLQHRPQEIRNVADLFRSLGTCNQILVRGYLGGCFLLPNFVGPIWVCWVVNADNAFLDSLAHLYGFAIGLLHMPLLVSLAINLVISFVFGLLRRLVESTSRFVWKACKGIPHDPAAAAQRSLAALHGWLERLPERIVDRIDRKLLRTEWAFMQLVTAFVIAACMSMLYTMIVDLYRPYL